jgi:hypothetical protein
VATGSASSKPANEVITGFLSEVTLQEQGGKRPCGTSEPYPEMIELELSRGRNARGSIGKKGVDLLRTVLEITIMIPAAHYAILERLLSQPQIERPKSPLGQIPRSYQAEADSGM